MEYMEYMESNRVESRRVESLGVFRFYPKYSDSRQHWKISTRRARVITLTGGRQATFFGIVQQLPVTYAFASTVHKVRCASRGPRVVPLPLAPPHTRMSRFSPRSRANRVTRPPFLPASPTTAACSTLRPHGPAQAAASACSIACQRHPSPSSARASSPPPWRTTAACTPTPSPLYATRFRPYTLPPSTATSSALTFHPCSPLPWTPAPGPPSSTSRFALCATPLCPRGAPPSRSSLGHYGGVPPTHALSVHVFGTTPAHPGTTAYGSPCLPMTQATAAPRLPGTASFPCTAATSSGGALSYMPTTAPST